MAKTYSAIKTVSDQIKNATTAASNTAAIVGGNLGDIVDKIQEVDGAKVPTSRTVNGKPLSGNIILNASDIGIATDLADKVSKTATETIGGTKTFSVSPIIPTPDADMKAATKKYVDDTKATVDATLLNKADLVGGKIPTSQLPAYVDDVLEYANLAAFPSTGETGKIYVALDTNLTYRWSGTAYVEISKSLALGETSSTAYRGDRGKTAYDHSQATGNAHGITASQIPNTPAGTIAATTVQGAINELDGDVAQVRADLNIIDDEVNGIIYNFDSKVFKFETNGIINIEQEFSPIVNESILDIIINTNSDIISQTIVTFYFFIDGVQKTITALKPNIKQYIPIPTGCRKFKLYRTGIAVGETSSIIASIVPNSKSHYAIDYNKDYNLLSKYDWIDGYYIGGTSGNLISSSSNSASQFISVDKTKGNYLLLSRFRDIDYNFNTNTYNTTQASPFEPSRAAFYDRNLNVLPTSYVSGYNTLLIPDEAVYFRCTCKTSDIAAARLIYSNVDIATSDAFVRVIHGKNEYIRYSNLFGATGYEKFNMVCFGCSITHGYTGSDIDGYSYVTYANDVLRANLINVGLGGTCAASRTDRFSCSFANLVDAIIDNNWANVEEYVTTINPSYSKHINTLKSVDWSEIDAISIMYGANDYATDKPISATYEPNPNTYNGAIAYGLERLLTAYPQLQVLVITPYDRYYRDAVVTTSSEIANSIGKTMKDYVDSIDLIKSKFRFPVLDLYNNSNINVYSQKAVLTDGTHAWTTVGANRLGRMFAESIRQNLYQWDVRR